MIFCYFVKKAKCTDWGFLEDDDQLWLNDDDDDKLDVEELKLLEELCNNEWEDEEEAMLDDLLSVLDDLGELEAEDGNLGRNTVMKVHLISVALVSTNHALWLQIFKLRWCMFNNSAMQIDLAVQCKHFKIEVQKMIHAIVTWWLTHGTVLQCAIELHPALNGFCDLEKWNKNLKKAMNRFKLNDNEWKFLEQLEPIFLVCSIVFLWHF